MLKNPNFWTSWRLILALPIILLLSHHTFWSLVFCLPLLAFAEFTDWLDGHVVRKYDKVSDFGKIYDPYCDATLHLLVLLFLIGYGLPIWVVAIFLARETSMACVRIYCALQGLALGAHWPGKFKTGFQIAFIFAYVLAALFLSSGYSVIGYGPILFWYWMILVYILLFIALALTVYSLAEYLYFVYQKFHISFKIVRPVLD